MLVTIPAHALERAACGWKTDAPEGRRSAAHQWSAGGRRIQQVMGRGQPRGATNATVSSGRRAA